MLSATHSFRPSLPSTAVLASLAALFLALGSWQLDRKAAKQVLINEFDNAPDLELDEAIAAKVRFARVSASGVFDARSFLLDNQVHQGRAGAQVITPLQLRGDRLLLVLRGWLPVPADRRNLPTIDTPGGEVTITGILNQPPRAGIQLGEADDLSGDDWPKLITYLNLDDVSDRLKKGILPWVLQLDAGDPNGFEDRQWQAVTMTPDRHGAYAVQWLALAVASLGCWIALGLRRRMVAKDGP